MVNQGRKILSVCRSVWLLGAVLVVGNFTADGAERNSPTSAQAPATVTPGPDDEQGIIAARAALRPSGDERGRRTINVFLIPLAVYVQRRYRQRMGAEDLIDGLGAPVVIVGRVRNQALPKRQLVHAERMAERTGRSGGQPRLIGVVPGCGPFVV